MSVHWPFPGQDEGPPPVYDLPPPRFAVGDRVITRWGWATVGRVMDWPNCSDTRAYHVRHDWCDSPPGFGHIFGEADMEPLVEPPRTEEPADEPPAAPAPQLELFA